MSVFSDSDFSGLHPDVIRQLSFLNFSRPTHVQARAIEPLVAGKDVLIQSATGSGKTIAFAGPLLHRLRTLDPPATRGEGTYAVILSPTKELCLQTFTVLTKLARMMPNLIVGHVAGGDNPQKEKARIRKGLTILCATPGRLVYHLQATQSFRADKIQTLVLDEADRLLDMGFEKQIREAHSRLINQNSKCQVVLVSATMTPRVKGLADWCLKKNSVYINADMEKGVEKEVEEAPTTTQAPATPISDEFVLTDVAGVAIPEVSTPSAGFTVPLRLTQKVAVVDLKLKLPCVIGELLQAQESGCRRVIVFYSSCASVEFYHELFATLRWPNFEKFTSNGPRPRREMKRKRNEAAMGNEETTVESFTGDKVFRGVSMNILHGDLNSTDRVGAMMDFAKNLTEHTKMRVLLCTDVAARGVDISQVDLVIQADPPQQTDEYLHRVGRTARIGNEGEALLFLAPNETAYIEHIRSKCATDVHFAKVSQKALLAECQKFNPESVANLRDFPQFLNSHIAQQVAANHDLDQMARKAFLCSLRAYRTFQGRELREIFNVKDLHGGHLAANFGLTDSPKSIAISMQQRKQEDYEKRDARQAHHKKRRFEHTLRLRQPKEADPPAKQFMGRVERPRKLDPKPITPANPKNLTAMEFQS